MARQIPAKSRQPQRRASPWITVLIGTAVVLALALVALLIFIETAPEPEPMTGPGRYPNAAGNMTFTIRQGWEAIHKDGSTRVEPQTGGSGLAAYALDVKPLTEINLVQNWNCEKLPDLVGGVAQAVMTWDATIEYTSVPCATDPTQPAYLRIYLALNDGSGRKALIVMGPLDGVRWVIARAGPFAGDAAPELVDAMTETVTSVEVRS